MAFKRMRKRARGKKHRFYEDTFQPLADDLDVEEKDPEDETLWDFYDELWCCFCGTVVSGFTCPRCGSDLYRDLNGNGHVIP